MRFVDRRYSSRGLIVIVKVIYFGIRALDHYVKEKDLCEMKLRLDIYLLGLSVFAHAPRWNGNSLFKELLETLLTKLTQTYEQIKLKNARMKGTESKTMLDTWDLDKSAEVGDVHLLLSVLIFDEIKRVSIWINPTYSGEDPATIDQNVPFYFFC